jgi:hypothetical protein
MRYRPCHGSVDKRHRTGRSRGLSNTFKAGSNVDTVTEDIIVIDDDVADVNPNTELDPDVLRHTVVLFSHATLDLDRAARCIHGAGKFHQHTVTGGLDYAAAMPSDLGIDKGLSGGLKLR